MKIAFTDDVEPDLIYKDHAVAVRRVGKGWRAMIYAPGSKVALRESPVMLEDSSKESIIAQAKWIVDARCTASSA
jgi:hypothetical protein